MSAPSYSILDGYLIIKQENGTFKITDEVYFHEFYDSYQEAVARITELCA